MENSNSSLKTHGGDIGIVMLSQSATAKTNILNTLINRAEHILCIHLTNFYPLSSISTGFIICNYVLSSITYYITDNYLHLVATRFVKQLKRIMQG